jgi:hypothetical protein
MGFDDMACIFTKRFVAINENFRNMENSVLFAGKPKPRSSRG